MANPLNFHVTSVKVTQSGGQPFAGAPTTVSQAEKPQACCHTCGQKATIHVTQVTGLGKTISKAFCLLHAIGENMFHPKAWDLLGTGDIMHRTMPAQLTCRCGMTDSLIRTKGRIGCAHCYITFASIIRALLPRLQHSCAHTGKAPRDLQPTALRHRRVAALQVKMQQAILHEAYETAAKVRDELQGLINQK